MDELDGTFVYIVRLHVSVTFEEPITSNAGPSDLTVESWVA